ncbi:NIL domain-containing protein, partial [Pseudomonas aeruginosa]
VMDSGAIIKQSDVDDVFIHPKTPNTSRCVFEAERVDEDERHDDLAHMPGLILRLTFRGEATYATLRDTMERQNEVDYSILSGRIDRTKDTPDSQLTLALVGGDLEAAMSQL